MKACNILIKSSKINTLNYNLLKSKSKYTAIVSKIDFQSTIQNTPIDSSNKNPTLLSQLKGYLNIAFQFISTILSQIIKTIIKFVICNRNRIISLLVIPVAFHTITKSPIFQNNNNKQNIISDNIKSIYKVVETDFCKECAEVYLPHNLAKFSTKFASMKYGKCDENGYCHYDRTEYVKVGPFGIMKAYVYKKLEN